MLYRGIGSVYFIICYNNGYKYLKCYYNIKWNLKNNNNLLYVKIIFIDLMKVILYKYVGILIFLKFLGLIFCVW